MGLPQGPVEDQVGTVVQYTHMNEVRKPLNPIETPVGTQVESTTKETKLWNANH